MYVTVPIIAVFFVMGLSFLLGVIVGWDQRGVAARELAKEQKRRKRSMSSQALEAIEQLAELRRAASRLNRQAESKSFVRSLEILEVRFQLAWMAYSQGKYRQARDIARLAYEQFR